MHFVVGLDLGHRSDAAIAFASWLQEESRVAGTQSPHSLTGVHVLEKASKTLAIQLAIHSEAELQRLASRAARAAIESAGGHTKFLDVVMERGDAAEAVLADYCQETQPDGLIIGRARPVGAYSFPRLGRVARRLLRSLPTSVLVVPPRLIASDLPAGPVLVGTDLTENSVPALRRASQLARSIGRGLHVAHVAVGFSELGPSYVPTSLLKGVRKEYEDDLSASLEAWIREVDVEVESASVELGTTTERLCGTARRVGAPLIVCGSRQLSLSQRIFQAPIGSSLAGAAHCPVMIVPKE